MFQAFPGEKVCCGEGTFTLPSLWKKAKRKRGKGLLKRKVKVSRMKGKLVIQCCRQSKKTT